MNNATEKRTDLRAYSGPDGKGWICDRCGESISNAGDGWLQWIEVTEGSGERKMRDLSLVHHFPASPLRESHEYGCQFNQQLEFTKDGGIVSDLGLDSFCGPDGLVHLLSLLADKGSSVQDVLTMVMRIHTPGYEHARIHIGRAIAEGIIEPNLPEGFYWQSDLNRVLDWAQSEKEDA
jgi:hypothetical protein